MIKTLKYLQLILFFLLININTSLFAREINAFSFEFPASTGGKINMSEYKGKTILLFAASTECGYKTQYKSFQEVHEKYKGKNVVVIGISSNDLNTPESKRGSDINKFCSERFGTTYPISDVVSINLRSSDKTHPFFKWAETQDSKFRITKSFEKFLIDKNGKLIEKYDNVHEPTGFILKDIEKIM